ARAAVEEEGDGPPRRVVRSVEQIGDAEDARLRRPLVVLEEGLARDGPIAQRLAADLQGMAGDELLRGSGRRRLLRRPLGFICSALGSQKAGNEEGGRKKTGESRSARHDDSFR